MSKPTNLRTNEPQMMRVMLPPPHLQAHAIPAEPQPPQQEARSMVPQFCAREGGAVDGYNQLRYASRGSYYYATSSESSMMNGRQNPEDQSRSHQKGKIQQTSPAGRRSQIPDSRAEIPLAYGACVTDPSQDVRFTAKYEGNMTLCSNRTPYNMARFPLVNLEFMTGRFPRPASPDDELAYGGGIGVRFRKSDSKTDCRSKKTRLGFPASVEESEPIQKGCRPPQPNKGSTISQVGGMDTSKALNSVTPASYHCPTNGLNQRKKLCKFSGWESNICMATSDRRSLDGIKHPNGKSPLHQEVVVKPHVAPVRQGTEGRSKPAEVPKFGSWEDAENYTAYFENVRKKKCDQVMLYTNFPPEKLPESRSTEPDEPGTSIKSNLDSLSPLRRTASFGIVSGGFSASPAADSTTPLSKETKVLQVSSNNAPVSDHLLTLPSNPKNKMNQNIHPPDHAKVGHSKVPRFGDWEKEECISSDTIIFNAPRGNKQCREPALNWARSPLLNEGGVEERFMPNGRASDEQAYGGGGIYTVPKMGSDTKDDSHTRIASQRFPASAAGSKAPIRKVKMASCFSWLGRGRNSVS